MLRYCGVMEQVIRARGSVASIAAQIFVTSSPRSRKPCNSKSRSAKWRSAAAAVPFNW